MSLTLPETCIATATLSVFFIAIAAVRHPGEAHPAGRLDTPTNRRYAGKYVDVLQYPDGRIEIQVAGVSLPYSTYDKLGTIDQGAIVENKRLGHVLRIAQVVQAERDNRAVSVPSTAHRVTGLRIPRQKIAGLKTQRELGPDDLRVAIQSVNMAEKSEKSRLATPA